MALITSERRHALIFAACLTAFIEISQATGLYGIYACPYRHFEIDDLILNVFGVWLGFTLAGRFFRGRKALT